MADVKLFQETSANFPRGLFYRLTLGHIPIFEPLTCMGMILSLDQSFLPLELAEVAIRSTFLDAHVFYLFRFVLLCFMGEDGLKGGEKDTGCNSEFYKEEGEMDIGY